MESKVKLMGHPVHPILIVFPLGLFIMALICDVLWGLTGRPTFVLVAFYDIAAGIIGGLAAALFGLLDWLALPAGTRAKQIGLIHGIGNVIVVVLFAISWLIRAGSSARVPTTLAFILALLAVGIAGMTGWMGGELVDRMGVGVDRGANLNAPSSLSGQPADTNRS